MNKTDSAVDSIFWQDTGINLPQSSQSIMGIGAVEYSLFVHSVLRNIMGWNECTQCPLKPLKMTVPSNSTTNCIRVQAAISNTAIGSFG